MLTVCNIILLDASEVKRKHITVNYSSDICSESLYLINFVFTTNDNKIIIIYNASIVNNSVSMNIITITH